ncbi:hypothetical protein CJF31_00011279 [Rutstroemia sp. NJR-2017a BVV2]|nr:hypothetical protein CJF31_00011279 [Rutstroemia sp. NJR-2017a BVV2]
MVRFHSCGTTPRIELYTICIILLYILSLYYFTFFRPFIKLTLIGSAILPRDVCDQAADAISALVKSYLQLYILSRTPSFVPYFVLTTGITHLIAYGNTSIGLEKFLQGISDLTGMSSYHGFASCACNILLYLARKWKIPLPEDDDLIAEADLDTWCRLSSISYNQFCPNVERVDIMKGIGTVLEDENPLFWLFPIQGRPSLVYRGGELKKNGFALLQE